MNQFIAKVQICLKNEFVKFIVNFTNDNEIKIELNDFIVYNNEKGNKTVLLFISTEDGSEINSTGTFKSEVAKQFKNKSFKNKDIVEVVLYNDNEILTRTSNKMGEEPKQSGNGGVLTVATC